jgi:Uncharacterised nucleotidyltransferase
MSAAGAAAASAAPSPEAELLLTRVCVSGCAAERSPSEDVDTMDWLAVAQLAEREKLLGVLWPALSGERGAIPDALAAAMRRQALVSEFRMNALRGRLGEVIRLLDDHGIEVMLLKGAALAFTRYESFARRPMGDLDLLIRDHQADEAWALLRAAGWSPEREGLDSFYAVHQHLCPLVAPGGAEVVVELHRSLLHGQGPFQLSTAEVWAAALPVEVDGRTVKVPAPEHLALHLCIHLGWSEGLRRGLARTIRDLGVLSPVVDWRRVAELSRAVRAESCCYWTLHLAASLGGVPVPAGVVDSLRPALPRWVMRTVERVVIAQALDPRNAFVPSMRLSRLAWSLAIRPRASGYGRSRPWTTSAEFDRLTNPAARTSVGRRVMSQLRALPSWGRFALVAAGLRGPSARRARTP